MRGFIPVTLLIVLGMMYARTQQPQASANDENQPALPAAAGASEQQASPELLPQSTALPASPPELPLPAPINLLSSETAPRGASTPKVQLSREEQAKIQARLFQLRAVAERMPRAAYLLKLADGALTDEAKREFLRAYHHTVCMEMRRLDPKIQQAINDYEGTQIRRLAQGPSHLVVASRRSRRDDKQHHGKTGDR
jgi:hypothetical protein